MFLTDEENNKYNIKKNQIQGYQVISHHIEGDKIKLHTKNFGAITIIAPCDLLSEIDKIIAMSDELTTYCAKNYVPIGMSNNG